MQRGVAHAGWGVGQVVSLPRGGEEARTVVLLKTVYPLSRVREHVGPGGGVHEWPDGGSGEHAVGAEPRSR